MSSRRGACLLRVSLIAIALCGGITACGDASIAGPVQSGAVSITIHNFMYGPATVQIKAGSTVTWTNNDPAPTNHTATANNGAFDTGHLAPGTSGSHTFTTPGTYEYHCSIHNYIVGQIIVT